jgi:hypothetical protein
VQKVSGLKENREKEKGRNSGPPSRPSRPPDSRVTLSGVRRFACAESSWAASPGLLPVWRPSTVPASPSCGPS